MRRLVTVAKKELLDGVRDHRSVLSALVFPFMSPTLLGLVAWQLTQLKDDRTETVTRLLVDGAENAPALVAHLDRFVDIEPAPEDAEAQILDGRAAVLLRIPEGFEEDLNASRPATVELLSDSSRTKSMPDQRRVRSVLSGWFGQMGAMRLLARGVDPSVMQPVIIDEVDLGTPERRAGGLIGDMSAMLLLVAVFFCNMYLAIDTTAGERERRSLECLLLTPTPRLALVMGKWLAGMCFGFTGVVMSLVMSAVTLNQIPLAEHGFRLNLGVNVVLTALVVLAPLTAAVSALQMAVAGFSRSFKEAQTWLSLVAMLPMVPGMLSIFEPLDPQPWMMLVPVLAQQVLLHGLFSGESHALSWQLAALGSSAVLALVSLAVHQWHLGRQS